MKDKNTNIIENTLSVAPLQEMIIYQTDDGAVKVDVQMADETVWLTIDGMSKLFDKSRSTINEHILHIFEEGELKQEETVRKIENSRFILSCCKFCNSCRLFSFWKQSVVRNNRTTNGGIFQNGNNHSKQQLFPFGNIVFKLPRKPRQLRVWYVFYDKCSIY